MDLYPLETKRALQANCEHENVEGHVSHFTGEFSHHCLDCDAYLFLWLEDDYEDDTE